MTELPGQRLELTMKADRLGEFFPILQQGFRVTAHVGCTLDKLLSRQWELSPDYVARRITTIFLDSRPVDDVTTAVVREGSVIALSGAMPGLVGATMRRGGYYAAFRGGISYRPDAGAEDDRIATVRVKLFNLLLTELGPSFCRRGMVLSAAELAEFLDSRAEAFWQGCVAALLNGRPVGTALLQSGDILSGHGTVRLTVNFKV